MLYVLSKHDTLACFESLGIGPSVTQRPAVIFPMYLLLSNARVGKYPLVTNLVRPVLARAGGQSQYSPALTSAVQSTEVNYVVGPCKRTSHITCEGVQVWVSDTKLDKKTEGSGYMYIHSCTTVAPGRLTFMLDQINKPPPHQPW
jgi:hypothetical protein